MVAAMRYAVVGFMIQTSGPGVVTAASRPARSAFICAAVVPVLVIAAVAPFVMAAGLVFATGVTVFVRSCASRYAVTPAVTVWRTVRSAAGFPSCSNSLDKATIVWDL
jgi:hypothetical protein